MSATQPRRFQSTSATSLTVNADAKVKGFDLELGYRPSKQFSISGNVNYARGRLSNASVPCNDANADGIPDAAIPTLASFGTEAIRYCQSKFGIGLSVGLECIDAGRI